ncbi:hypothetical protein Pint_32966 [Pistacia integerrima]|uniref:Uncharacterized protein n=1 Tax=Pistacia integerrima TaxID=434235 RepID=A0ACC0X4G0_9ROSI|nr:hypothetical protein Pint_32966 [Pistacia integerrima]
MLPSPRARTEKLELGELKYFWMQTRLIHSTE